MKQVLTLSSLGHTWILDLDGTIVKHNGYKIDGHDTFIGGAREFLKSIPKEDMIIFITSRKIEYKELTEKFLSDNNIRYDCIIYEAPYGERILMNDDKTSGLNMAHSIRKTRDEDIEIELCIDKVL